MRFDSLKSAQEWWREAEQRRAGPDGLQTVHRYVAT